MNLVPLRMFLLMDAAFLFLLGGFFALTPGPALNTFHFPPMPGEARFLVCMWGCVLATMSFGYLQAVRNPLANLSWLQVGIARGALEVVMGLYLITSGVLTWQQGGLSVGAGSVVALTYLILYPRGGK